jgi:hypothetical protein
MWEDEMVFKSNNDQGKQFQSEHVSSGIFQRSVSILFRNEKICCKLSWKFFQCGMSVS